MEPTSAKTSTTLRPRNRRRTNEDDDGEGIKSEARVASNLDDSPSKGLSPRDRSPRSRTRPHHGVPLGQNARQSGTSSRFDELSGEAPLQPASSNFTSTFLDNPWASLQSLASTLVGNDRKSGRSTPNRSPTRKRRPIENNAGFGIADSPPVKWGPPGNEDRQLGFGTRKDRIAQLQVKKREALLATSDQSYDAGRYKRRDSDDRNRDLADNEDRDQLVYLHKVRPEDTLAGITIKYNCQANIFRKVNRLWPNDSVQIRKIVVLPVDACAIRGRKILSDPSANGTFSSNDTFSITNGDIMPTPTATTLQLPWGELHEAKSAPSDRQTPESSMPTSPSISAVTSNPDEPRWIHDSWVAIDGFHDAVEIARLSRRALGYFPRSRRKSVSLSDLDSPQPSFDLPRSSFQATTASPQRRASNATSKTRPGSGSHLAKGLHGVGGVGTMGSNVRSPGPAQDGLNKMFAAHLPNLAPKKSSDSLHSSASHGTGGIENVGGAIEGWVRKLATKAQTSFQPPTPSGKSGVGDLIELSEDVFDLEVEGSERAKETDGRRNRITGWTAEQQEQMLHERFPPRGRVFGETSNRGKSS